MPRWASALATLALFATLLGCDSSSPTAPIQSPAPAGNWQGDWQGTTGQGKAISFTVGGPAQAPRLTAYELTIQIDDLDPGSGAVVCGFAEVGVEAAPVSVPIVNGAFAFDIAGLAGTTLRFEGVFESSTSASGQLKVEAVAPSNCAGRGVTSWTAQKA